MKKVFFLFVIAAAGLMSCTGEQKSGSNKGDADSVAYQKEEQDALSKLENLITSDTGLLQVAQQAVRELAGKKIPSATCYSEPLILSPSPFIQSKSRTIKDSEEAEKFFGDKSEYVWGTYAGSGDPIKLSNEEYYAKFIFERDYTKAEEVSVNQEIASGNTANNLDKVFPDSDFVDFHFKGTEDNKYMDWSTLRLVFKKVNGNYCLVGIVHDQWSI